ncbi:hypothetical protein OC835_005478 [Tilletia horrida]|nr:hypothetical protein OC835_005478 [Tilletia horrida]
MSRANLVHIVAYGGAMWGHIRSLIILCIKLAALSPNLVITLPLMPDLRVKAVKEVEHLLPSEGLVGAELDDVRARCRFVAVEPPADWTPPAGAEARSPVVLPVALASAAFQNFIVQTFDRSSSQAGGSGNWPLPSLFLVDFFVKYDRELIRKHMPQARFLLFWSTSLSYLLFCFSPEAKGPASEWIHAVKTIKDEAQLELALGQAGGSTAADKLDLGDCPGHFRHEHFPCRMTPVPDAGLLLRHMASNFLQTSDGVVLTSGAWLETISAKKIHELFDIQQGRPTYNVNMMIPTKLELLKEDSTGVKATSSDPVVAFMDKALAEEGEQSVLYISFGTAWGPLPWQVEVLIKTLVAAKRRFVLSTAAKFYYDTPEANAAIERAEKLGLGMAASWIPQTTVLKHSALLAFLTHGGWNSFCESLIAAVPMILWPFCVEQPFMASLLSAVDEPAAWQLYEVRGPSVTQFVPFHFASGPRTSERGEPIPVPTGTPEALQREFERVLVREAARGSAELARRRERMVALREKYLESTKPGGETHRAMAELLTPLGCVIKDTPATL